MQRLLAPPPPSHTHTPQSPPPPPPPKHIISRKMQGMQGESLQTYPQQTCWTGRHQPPHVLQCCGGLRLRPPAACPGSLDGPHPLERMDCLVRCRRRGSTLDMRNMFEGNAAGSVKACVSSLLSCVCKSGHVQQYSCSVAGAAQPGLSRMDCCVGRS